MDMSESIIFWVITGYVVSLVVAVVIIHRESGRPVCPVCLTDPCECHKEER